VLLEAAGCETPFVASRVGGIPEIAHLAMSNLVKAGDSEGLAKSIEESLEGNFGGDGEVPGLVRDVKETAKDLAGVLAMVVAEKARILSDMNVDRASVEEAVVNKGGVRTEVTLTGR